MRPLERTEADFTVTSAKSQNRTSSAQDPLFLWAY